MMKTRMEAWQFICEVLDSPVGWTYFSQLCGRGKGPVVSGTIGRNKLYRDEDLRKWVDTRNAKKPAQGVSNP